ncbi:MAG: division/cell wall cluster transcriptional repressor MraZ [Clostridia bacterium]|nr:division/cell wall cluster transcriptional repressor MraZ [Clostridia bacterium]
MLIGTYRHSLDAKKRMRMPSKLKNEIGSNFIITKGTNKNLLVFSKADFDALYLKLTSLPIFDEAVQKPIRKFLSSAFEAEEDSQGRVLLDKELCSFAGFVKNIVFVGVGNRVEIWAEELWDKEDEDNEIDFSVLAKLGV